MSAIYLIAGEASGDFLGAKLMAALRAYDPTIVFYGIGGPLMTGEGLHSLFPMTELSVMGIAEVAPKLPNLVRRIKEAVNDIAEKKPDVVVTIDAPDFCFRVAKAVRKSETRPKLIHYVAPTVWAWREGRAAKIAQFLDGLICLFDFEPPYFEREGLRSFAVGHPLIEGGALHADGAEFRMRHQIAAQAVTIGALFGSRHGELQRTGPIIKQAAYRLLHKASHLIVPTLPHLKTEIERLLTDCPVPVVITTDPDEKYSAFKAMNIGIAVSGTVGLELAALQIPHVIAYRANPVTAAIARRLLKVKYAHLANIMAVKEIVPEFLQERCQAEMIASAAEKLLIAPEKQKEAMAGIAARLGADQLQTPSQKAAAFVLSFVK